MEHKKIKYNRGYLLVISVAIITIIAIIATMLITMFDSGMRATENVSEGQSAFYLAASGLQIAKRDIIYYTKNCTYINREPLYTDAKLLDQNDKTNIVGQYTITGSANKVKTFLSSNISDITTTIPLQNVVTASDNLATNLSIGELDTITLNSASAAKQFAVSGGIVKIDNEYISYKIRDGVNLKYLNRGIEQTVVADHSSGSIVIQGLLAQSGVIRIDDEMIGYKNIVGNTLTGVTRGVMNTANTPHLSTNNTVYQDQCILFAEAWVPSKGSITGRRLIRELVSINADNLRTLTFAYTLYENLKSTLITTGTRIGYTINTWIGGASLISNQYILDFSSFYFPGSTILSTMIVDLSAHGQTLIQTGVSSDEDNKRGDIKENFNLSNQRPLFDYIFSVPDYQTIANNIEVTAVGSKLNLNTVLNTPSNYNKIIQLTGPLNITDDNGIITTSVQPKILIIDGDFIIGDKKNQITIGTPDKPVVLYVRGNLHVFGENTKLILYGLLYVEGNFYVTCVGGDATGAGGSKAVKTGTGGKSGCLKCETKRKKCLEQGPGGTACKKYEACLDKYCNAEKCNNAMVYGLAVVRGIVDFDGSAQIYQSPEYIGKLRMGNDYLTSVYDSRAYSTKEIIE